MAGYGDVINVRIPLVGMASIAAGAGTITVGTTNVYAFKAPAATNGGGITIIGAQSYSSAGDGAGSALTVAIHKYSTAYAVNGTIASAAPAAGSLWPAGTPSAYTISSAFVNAGEHVVLNVIGTAASATASNRAVTIQYVMGY